MTASASSVQANLQRAMALHQQGRLDEADGFYARVIEAAPEHIQAIRLQGILARQSADYERSARLLTRLCELTPGDPSPWNELGLTRLAGGDLYAAEQALKTAVDRDAGFLPARVNLGAVLQRRGYYAAAAGHYAACLETRPDDLDIRCNLANALLEAGQGERALAEIDQALTRMPAESMLLANRGVLLLGLDRHQEAVAVLEDAAEAAPGDDMPLLNLATARRRTGDPAGAARALHDAVRINPANARAVADLANLEMELGQAEQALRRCQDFLAHYPGERLVLSAYIHALADSGQAEQAAALQGLDELVTIVDCAAPDGFAELAEFNAALAGLVLADPSCVSDPVRKATTGGMQTGELAAVGHPALACFERLVRDAIERTVECWRRRGHGEHPVMAYASEHWGLRMWGTVLGPGGSQSAHMHPLGWISGVYYVQLPGGMRGPEADAGALEFGRPPDSFHTSIPPELRLVRPAAGRLVLFPSWYFHRTLPFGGDGQRISLAFDAVPLAGRSTGRQD